MSPDRRTFFLAPAALLPVFVLVAISGAAHAADSPSDPAGYLIDTLGLHVDSEPVRKRPGWRPPHLILTEPKLKGLLQGLREVAPGVRIIDIREATPRDIAEAEATFGVCDSANLAQMKHLKWIQMGTAGVETCVQQPLVRERRPLVTNTQRVVAPSMAEHVLALMMALSRHLIAFITYQQQARWVQWSDVPALEDLQGKTVLIVGLGGVGTEVAIRAHALGMRVIATRASGHNGPEYVSYVGLPDELLKLTREADFVVDCAPLTPQSSGIFNREFFATMKRSAYFVSIARGGSTVTSDLIAALEGGVIAGAALDVVDPEPLPPDNPLWRAPNLIITPHISADTPTAMANYVLVLKENLRRYVSGEPMLSVVDIERGY